MYSVNTLITESLNSGDVRYLQALPLALFNSTEKLWVSFIIDYVGKYKQPPTVERLIKEHPSFRREPVDDGSPVADIYDKILPVLQNNYLIDRISEDFKASKGNLTPEYLAELSSSVAANNVELITLNDLNTEIFYKDRKLYKFGYGATWFDSALGGLDWCDFGIISGRAKSAKTTLLSILAVSLFKQGYNLLIVNNELDKTFFAGKIVSLLKGFNPKVFRTLNFDEDLKVKLKDFEQEMSKYENKMYIYGRIGTPAELISAYESCDPKPDIILIDAINNMGNHKASSYSDHAMSIANVAVQLRQFILDNHVPVIATSQLNRGAANTNTPGQETMAGSDEFVRQADWVVTTAFVEYALSAIEDPILRSKFESYDDKVPFYYLNTMVNRHGANEKVCLHINWEDMKVIYATPKDTLEPFVTEESLPEDIKYDS